MMHEQLIAKLEERYRIMQEKAPDLAAADNLHKQAAAALREDAKTIAELTAENERLKGKIVSPEVTTMCHCQDCGAATRMGRHLDIDCETISDLRAKLEKVEEVKEEAIKEVAKYKAFLGLRDSGVARKILEDQERLREEIAQRSALKEKP